MILHAKHENETGVITLEGNPVVYYRGRGMFIGGRSSFEASNYFKDVNLMRQYWAQPHRQDSFKYVMSMSLCILRMKREGSFVTVFNGETVRLLHHTTPPLAAKLQKACIEAVYFIGDNFFSEDAGEKTWEIS